MALQSILQCSALHFPARQVNDEKLSRGGITEQLPAQNPQSMMTAGTFVVVFSKSSSFCAHLMSFLLNFRGFASTVHSCVSCRVTPDHTILHLEKTETRFRISGVCGVAFIFRSLSKASEHFLLPRTHPSAVELARNCLGFCGLFQHC